METLKKYWPLFLLLPVAIYVGYKVWQENQKVNDSTAKAREAKLLKSTLAKLEKETDEEAKVLSNGASHSTN